MALRRDPGPWTAALVLAAALAAGGAGAVAINDGAGLGRAAALGAPFTSVAKIDFGGSSCSGALVSRTTVLTADHCVADGQDVGDIAMRFYDETGGNRVTRRAAGLRTFPDALAAAGDPSAPFTEIDPDLGFLSGFDLALIELAIPLDDRAPFGLFAGDPFGRTGLFVGYGAPGLGSTGRTGDADETRRAATNATDFAVSVDGRLVPNLFAADFDEVGGLPDEGSVLFGDSGGPILLESGGEWLVFGVATAVGRTRSDVAFGGYDSFSIWTGVATPQAAAFLTDETGAAFAPVPLPPAAAMLACALIGLAALRGGARSGA